MTAVIGIIAVIVAYLIGAIPTAYIVTLLIKKKDIRKLGGGNVGTRNVFREVGKFAGVIVGILDIAKGIVAVYAGYLLLGKPSSFIFFERPPAYLLNGVSTQPLEAAHVFLLAAGLTAVAGHIWPVYLKFEGGNGLAASLGVLSILMTREVLLALAVTLLLVFFSRNPVMSFNVSLLTLPVTAWAYKEPFVVIIFPIILILLMAANFLPTAREALKKAGGRKAAFAGLLRRRKLK